MKGTKIIAAVIAGALTIGAIPVRLNNNTKQTGIIADAAETLTYGDYMYQIQNDSQGEYIIITDYIGNESTIVIPSIIKGIPVKSIGYCSFGSLWRSKCENLEKLVIPEGVTSIEKAAFYYCDNLKTVNLPNSLTKIGKSAFQYCKSLETVTIPPNITNFDTAVFTYCESLKKVNISDGATIIGGYAFNGCTSLIDISIPDSIINMGNGTFKNCENLSRVTIPDSVQYIGNEFFYGCKSLSSVSLSNNLTSIPDSAFSGCSSLKEITLPYYVSAIGTDAFNKTSLEVINIGEKLKSLENLPIHSTSLKAINVPDDSSYFSSEDGILYNKDKSILIRFPAALNQTEYKAPDTVATISESAFADNTNIRNVYLYEKCSSVEPTAFQRCSHLDKIYFYNKNCDIYMSKDTIYEDAVINGYKNSTAEEYADMYGRAFNALTSNPSIFFGKWQAYKVNYQGEYIFPTSTSIWQNATWIFKNDYSGEYYTTNNGTNSFNWRVDGNSIIANSTVIEYDGTDLFIKTISDGEELIYAIFYSRL